MKVYLGGQINRNHRGTFALLIGANQSTESVDCFLHPLLSEDFFQITGERAASYPLERIYEHISPEIGKEIIRDVSDMRFKDIDFLELDRRVVINFFLNNDPERPDEIILRRTRTGYEVVEPK